MAMIEIDKVSKWYGSFQVLKNCSTHVDKGEVVVPVTVTDASGEEPIQCEFIWAWVPSQRPPKTEATKNDI